jgi:hypothetical protein
MSNHSQQQARRVFESRIASSAEEDDPLDAYVQYVQWIVSTYGEQDKSSGLLALLQKATVTFQEDKTYHRDLRYLKLWIQYTHQVDIPTAITTYAFLLKKDIGTQYAVLYQEYAEALERAGK